MPTETLYLPLAPGVSARLEIEIRQEPALPSPNEPEIRRAPTVRELALVAEQLAARNYQFRPIDG
jgi:hypothetical protein